MMDDAGQIATWGLALRIGERLVITALVIVVCLVVTVGFWRSIQRVDFQFGRDKLSGAANVVLATPVFALLALIGFAWVSFSHPATIRVPGTAPETAVATELAGPTAAGQTEYIGAVPGRAATVDAYERQRIEGVVRRLNCVAASAGRNLAGPEADALAEARLSLLLPVWADEWGDPMAFRIWALGRSSTAPDPDAAMVFAATAPDC